MSMIQNEDAIAQAIRSEDDAGRARFRDLQQAHIERLRAELADERRSRREAERLTQLYAILIGELKEQVRVLEQRLGGASC